MIGASIAYQLSRRGVSVLVLDKEGLAAGASGANCGLVLWSDAEPGISAALAREGAVRVSRLAEELDFDLEYRPATGFAPVTTDEEERAFRADCDRLSYLGFPARMLEVDEVRRREPHVRLGPEVRSVLCTEEGVLNPFRLVLGYWRQARRWGAVLAAGVTVQGFAVAGDRIRSVLTSRGEITAGEVVLAAGAWTRALAAQLGLDLPEYYIQAEALVTEPVPPLLHGFLHQGDLRRIAGEARVGRVALETGWESYNRCLFEGFDFCAVQTGNGNLLIGQMTYIHPCLRAEVSLPLFRHAARETMRMLPQLRDSAVLRAWRSPVPFTPDHLPLLGRVGSWRNLTVASGFKSTIIVTPRVGESLAELITEGRSSLDLSPFDPLRFCGHR